MILAVKYIAKQKKFDYIACCDIYPQYRDNFTCNKEHCMSKAGMRRPNPKEPHGTESNRKTRDPKNDEKPVPELSGKAKHSKEKAQPILYD